jgi:MFS family permease
LSAARAGRRAAFVFGVAAFFSDVAHEAVGAVLPAFLLLLGGTPRSLGWVEGVADAAAAFCKLYAGRFADRSRALKPATTFGYVVSAVALPLIAASTSWLHVVFLRGAALAGRGFRSPLRDQLLARAVPADGRGAAFGLERAMDQSGGLVASLAIAAVLSAGVSTRSVIAATAVPGLLAAAAIAFLVREKPSPVDAPAPLGDGGSAPLRRLLLSVGVYGVGDFPVNLAILWAAGIEEGATAAMAARAATLYAVYKATAAPAAYVAGRISDRTGRRPVYVAGLICGLFGACVPAAIATPSFGAGACVAAASGLLYGVQESVQKAWAADLAPPRRRGRAFGSLHALRGVAALVSGVLTAELWHATNARVAFGVCAVFMAAGVGVAASVRGSTSAPAAARSPRK